MSDGVKTKVEEMVRRVLGPLVGQPNDAASTATAVETAVEELNALFPNMGAMVPLPREPAMASLAKEIELAMGNRQERRKKKAQERRARKGRQVHGR